MPIFIYLLDAIWTDPFETVTPAKSSRNKSQITVSECSRHAVALNENSGNTKVVTIDSNDHVVFTNLSG